MDLEDRGQAPARPPRPAVMADVGRLAGVSHQTVSRVINGSRHVSPATRERVLAAMHELGYRPNSIARALVTGRSQTLGVVSFDTTLYGPASTLFGIERAAHEAGYFIIIASLKALDRSSVAEALDRLRLQAVDGILVIVSEQEAAEALLDARADCPAGRGRSRARERASRWWRSISSRGPRPPPVTCWSSGTARCGTWPARPSRWKPSCACAAGGRPCAAGGASAPAAAGRGLERAFGL